jgi:hypothetical protein
VAPHPTARRPRARPPVSKLAFFDFWGWTLDLLRRILYLGTRTQVFPESPEALKLRPDLPVCYVLHEHHLSNLLVLDHECGKLGLPPALHPMRDEAFSSPRSFFFLSRNERGAWCPIRAVSAPDAQVAGQGRLQIRVSTCSWCR